MIITGKWIVIATAVGMAGLGIGWRVMQPRVPIATSAVIVADVSGSTADERASILGLAAGFVSRADLAKGATLTVLTTGDNKSAGEPRFIATYEVPFNRRFVEGKGALLKRKQEILADLDVRLQKVRRTDQSPIFLAVKRGLEQLHASGCRSGSKCLLFLRTDGEELSEPAIKRALETEAMAKDLPAGVANEGIGVMFCGMAETNDASNADAARTRALHTASHGDRLRQVWLSLFTSPALVTFEPYCPKAESKPVAQKSGD